MIFLVEPYQGIGNINLGMSREKIRSILNDCDVKWETFMKTPTSIAATDAFTNLGMHIFYEKSDVCEAIEVFAPAKPILLGKCLLGVKYQELEAWFREIDDTVAVDDYGLTSHKFGVGLYVPDTVKFPDAVVEGVIVFARGYYDDVD
jgi:hypothetical protein